MIKGKMRTRTAFVMLLAGMYLYTGEGLIVQAQESQKVSPFALPDKNVEQDSKVDAASSSNSVFRLPDKKQKEIKKTSSFALPETDKSVAAATKPAPPEAQAQPDQLFKDATAAAKQGRYEEAGKMYSRLLELDPTNVKAMNNLGLVLKKLGRNEDALQAYHYAIQADESYPLTYKNMGILLEQMQDKKGAIQAYKSYVQLVPEAADARAVQERVNWLLQ